jgi:hypothetical protein
MKKVYVTATDKFFSGWGPAEGKKNKLVLECENLQQAHIVAENLYKRPEMIYVNIVTKRKPYFNSNRFYTSFKTIEDCPSFYKGEC